MAAVICACIGFATTEIGPKWRQRAPVRISRWQTLLAKWLMALARQSPGIPSCAGCAEQAAAHGQPARIADPLRLCSAPRVSIPVTWSSTAKAW